MEGRLKPMSGIFYDPHRRRLHIVHGAADPRWTLVTHNVCAGIHQCRRIMREWLPSDELGEVDWSGIQRSA
jgi:hypothetical protein